MAKYNCEDIKELLYDYVEELLTAKQKTIVAHHLESCTECTKELNEIKQIVSLLQNLPEERLPQDFDEKLHLALIAAATDMDERNSAFKNSVDAEQTVSETASESMKLESLKAFPKKPLWQRAWFPRSVAAAIVLFFGIVSASYANEYFGFWDFGSQTALDNSSGLELANKAENTDMPTAATITSASEPKEDASVPVTSDTAKEQEILAGSVFTATAKALPAAGICGDSVNLASREGGVHEYMPLLPENLVVENSADVDASKMSFNSHIASDEAADKNYYWQNYDYAKLTLLVENKADALKKAAAITQKLNGCICKDFYEYYNKDITLTAENSVMLDVPADSFDAALTALSSLGNIETCYLPDEASGNPYTYEESGITYRSVVVIFEEKQ